MSIFLDGRSKQQKIEDAKKLLQDNGYCVYGPLIKSNEVRTPAQLVRFFYDEMAKYNPDFSMVYSGNVAKDRSIAKRLIEARVQEGSSYERAVEECCQLIRMLFKYEDYLGLSSRITSMGVLGQEAMSWVTAKIWQIHEGLNKEVNEFEDSKWWDELYLKQEDSYDEGKLLEARNRMDRILERNAKEKERNRDS